MPRVEWVWPTLHSETGRHPSDPHVLTGKSFVRLSWRTLGPVVQQWPEVDPHASRLQQSADNFKRNLILVTCLEAVSASVAVER